MPIPEFLKRRIASKIAEIDDREQRVAQEKQYKSQIKAKAQAAYLKAMEKEEIKLARKKASFEAKNKFDELKNKKAPFQLRPNPSILSFRPSGMVFGTSGEGGQLSRVGERALKESARYGRK